MEFYSSKYVFEGGITSKVYAKDSLTCIIAFSISKHYKKGDEPNILKFELTAESNYTNIWTSCDWKAEKGEKWLVYAYEYQSKITFSEVCSNSRSLNYRPIRLNEQRVLDNGNQYIYI